MKNSTSNKKDPTRDRLLSEFGVKPDLLQGADPQSMALVLEDLMGQGAQSPVLTAREQLLLDAARRPIAQSGERLGAAIDQAFVRDVVMPELTLRSMLTAAEPDATRVAPKTAPGMETAAPAVMDNVAQQLGSPQSILGQLGLPMTQERRTSSVRGGESTKNNVLELLKPSGAAGKKSDPKGGKKDQDAGSSMASLLPILGVGAIVAALVASKSRGGEQQPAAAGRDPAWGSLERGGRTTTTQTRPNALSQILIGAGGTLGTMAQVQMANQNRDLEIAQREVARRQDLGLALLKAGAPELAMNFLGPDNPELEGVDAEQMAQLKGGEKDMDSLLELGQIVSRIGGPEEKKAWLEEAWSSAGLKFPESGITITDEDDAMPASMERWMLENGIDPGESSRIDARSRKALLEIGKNASAREKADARFDKLNKFVTMVEKSVVAGLATDQEASAMKENVLPELQAVAKELGKAIPVMADSEGATAPTVQTMQKVPTAEVISDLRSDSPKWYGKGRAWTEAKLNELAEEPGNPQIKAELDRIFNKQFGR